MNDVVSFAGFDGGFNQCYSRLCSLVLKGDLNLTLGCWFLQLEVCPLYKTGYCLIFFL